MAKSKWYNWLLNPLGALVNNVTQNADFGSVGDALNHIMNPAKTIVEGAKSVFDKQTNLDKNRKHIEELAAKAGMSVEEFLELNPDYQKPYYEGDAFLNHVESYINNATGERDTAENEKNRQFQHDEAEIARNWEAEQAKAAREWDSIGAQMERAASAGVNPISIAMQNGGINASATTSIPSSPGIPVGSSGLMHNGALDIASMIFQGIGTLADNRLKQSQSDDIVIMRQYNIAEKQANTAHLQQLCESVGLSNVAQGIQNRWLNTFNQMNYIQMQLDQGVSRATIMEKNSISRLNAVQISDIQQNMRLNLDRFNATLPIELQLMESELDLKKKTAQDVYEEICLRHLQKIEQENRNQQSAADAESAQTAANLAKATYEDAISAFHNDMVKGAAEAGVSLNDYNYYGIISHSPTEAVGKAGLQLQELNHKRKNFIRRIFGASDKPYYDINGYTNTNLRGLN